MGILENTRIEHKFYDLTGISEIAREKIILQLQNMVSSIKFLIGYPGFQYNQSYKPCYIYNSNKDQVYYI